MKDKYKNKYRINSTRLKYWNYGSDALYFVTICTKNREYFFGDVIDGEMQLTEIGKMAKKYWLEIPQHFPFVVLHQYIIMPNHIHGIIEIAKKNDKYIDNQNIIANKQNGDTRIVETQNFASLQYNKHQNRFGSQSQNFASLQYNKQQTRFGPQSQNLASIIRGYKIGVTKNAQKINPYFEWQSRYYDHIIRNQKSFENITQYIINNPKNWNNDKYYK